PADESAFEFELRFRLLVDVDDVGFHDAPVELGYTVDLGWHFRAKSKRGVFEEGPPRAHHLSPRSDLHAPVDCPHLPFPHAPVDHTRFAFPPGHISHTLSR